MPEIFKRRIFKLLKHADYAPLKPHQLASAVGVTDEDAEKFKSAFDELQASGRIVVGAGNLVTLPALPSRIIGTFRANPKGFGFVSPLESDLHIDLFIPPGSTGNAVTGDIVAAKVVERSIRQGRPRYSGRVVEIMQRGRNRFVGTLLKEPIGWIVRPDGTAFVEPIAVDDVTAKNAHPHDKVVVEIISYPSEHYVARGVIIEVLGRAGQYDTEISSIIHQFSLPTEFEEDCLEQARQAATEFKPEEGGKREDLTDKVIVTIDPPDAKDFDDAISLEKDTDDNWVLGVHIADVSHFIAAGSALDTEAKERGNSTYLPGKVIPMLPEVLSNGVCSLQPEQKRFCKTAFITYDQKAKILSRRYANSVIRSTKRLTYQQVDKILKGHTKHTEPAVVELLKDMETLSRIIETRRLEAGMLHLDLPEMELVLDKAGRVADAEPADVSYPHTMIEMFMVEANEAVASLLDRLQVPFMRRIHPDPDVLSLKNLARLAGLLGFKMPRTPDRHAMQNLLDSMKGTSYSFAVNMMVLRSLEKAVYSPLRIGHYALASTNYGHFTSPIRRYADLLIHRQLQDYLEKRGHKASERLSEQELVEIGKHLTFTEQRSEDAERELKTVLLLQMLSSRMGEEMDCVVTGTTGFGVFVQSTKYGIEGLIQLHDLGPGQWRYEAKAQVVVNLRSGYTIRLGQPIKVRILNVNIPARQLGLAPAKPLEEPAERKKKKKEKFEAVKEKKRKVGRGKRKGKGRRKR